MWRERRKREWRFQNLVVPLELPPIIKKNPMEMAPEPADEERPFNEIAFLTTKAFQDRQLLPKLTEAILEIVKEAEVGDILIPEAKLRKKLFETAQTTLPDDDFRGIFPHMARKESKRRLSQLAQIRRATRRASQIRGAIDGMNQPSADSSPTSRLPSIPD